MTHPLDHMNAAELRKFVAVCSQHCDLETLRKLAYTVYEAYPYTKGKSDE